MEEIQDSADKLQSLIEDSFRNGFIDSKYLIGFWGFNAPYEKLYIYVTKYVDSDNHECVKELNEFLSGLVNQTNMKAHTVLRFVTEEEYTRACIESKMGSPRGCCYIENNIVMWN